MSTDKLICPSCGVAGDSGTETCPNCGAVYSDEMLQEEIIPSDEQVAENTPPSLVSALKAVPKSVQATAAPKRSRKHCTTCGVVNPADARFCLSCGQAFDAVQQAVPAARKSSNPQFFVIALVAVLVLTFTAHTVFTPKSVMGPPRDTTAQNAVPPGHPQVDGKQGSSGVPEGHPTINQPQASPEQYQALDLARRAYAANPQSDSAKLRLANALYDVSQHAEALGYYKDYLSKHPDDVDARTDMAFSIFLSANDPDAAIKELREVVKRKPSHQPATFNMAMMFLAKHEHDSVNTWLNKTIAIDSTSPQGLKARQAIEALKQEQGK